MEAAGGVPATGTSPQSIAAEAPSIKRVLRKRPPPTLGCAPPPAAPSAPSKRKMRKLSPELGLPPTAREHGRQTRSTAPLSSANDAYWNTDDLKPIHRIGGFILATEDHHRPGVRSRTRGKGPAPREDIAAPPSARPPDKRVRRAPSEQLSVRRASTRSRPAESATRPMVSEGLRLPSPVLDPPEPPSTSAQDASQDIQLRGTGLGADAATSEASIEPALDNRELEKVVLPPTPPETPLLDAGLPVEETSAPNPSAKTALLGPPTLPLLSEELISAVVPATSTEPLLSAGTARPIASDSQPEPFISIPSHSTSLSAYDLPANIVSVGKRTSRPSAKLMESLSSQTHMQQFDAPGPTSRPLPRKRAASVCPPPSRPFYRAPSAPPPCQVTSSYSHTLCAPLVPHLTAPRSQPNPSPPPLPPTPLSSETKWAQLSADFASHLATPWTLSEEDAVRLLQQVPLPPLPLPAPTPKPTRVTAKKGAQRPEYIADKSSWILPEKDLITKAGFPPIWCLGRQELCESLPYFKSYQGGHYDLGECCHGYLLDGFGSALDRLEARGRIIISHGGGCSEGEGENYRLKEDQKRDNVRVRALINCQRTQTPVVLLAGSNYTHFPWLQSLGVRYCVLGYYFVRDVWVEAEPIASKPGEYFTRFKFVFEWAPSQGVPWFDSVIGVQPDPAQPPSAPIDFASDNTRLQSEQIHCAQCSQWSPHVFEEPLLCYNEACPAFFQLPSGERPSPLTLNYRPSFLLPLAAAVWPSIVPQPLLPIPLQELGDHPADYSRAAWRGFHCNHCGRLSSRSDWRALTCDGCGSSVDMRVRVFPDAKELQHGVKRMRPSIEGTLGVTMSPLEGIPGWAGWTIDVGEDTRVHHLWPSDGLEKEDQLFQEYQGAEAGKLFKRNTLSTHRLPGSYLCSQFSFNTGQVYNHVVNVETFPFDRPIGMSGASTSSFNNAEVDSSLSPIPDRLPSPPLSSIDDRCTDGQQRAPPCVRQACEHLSAVVQQVCVPTVETVLGFNEVLSVAYMEGGKMSYHDDGEQGLGPIVASLSLGADATMSFRRKQLKKSRAKGAKADGAESREKPSTKPVIKLQLRHGDVTIMEGRGVQRDLDHMVEPVNLRFAATARFIGLEHKTRTTIPASRTRGIVCPPGLRQGPSPPLQSVQLPTPPQSVVKKPRKPRVVKPKLPSSEMMPPLASTVVRPHSGAPLALPPPLLRPLEQLPPLPKLPTLPPPQPTFAPVQPSPPNPTAIASQVVLQPFTSVLQAPPPSQLPPRAYFVDRSSLPSPIPQPIPDLLVKDLTRSKIEIEEYTYDRQLHNQTSRGTYPLSSKARRSHPAPSSTPYPTSQPHQRLPPCPWSSQDYVRHPYVQGDSRRASPSPSAPTPVRRPKDGIPFSPSKQPPGSRLELTVEQAVEQAFMRKSVVKKQSKWSVGKVLAPDRR